MKVLYILNHFLPSQNAGIEVYGWSLAKKLKENGLDVKIVIPNYNQVVSAVYNYDGIKVHQYPEPSIVDRSLIMGFRQPDGLQLFVRLLKSQKPDIVHFHEIAGSNGITLHHVEAVKKLGIKTLFTFHLSGLSCMTGTLVQNGLSICDGKIKLLKCSQCFLKTKKLNSVQSFLLLIATYSFKICGIDPTKLSNRLGTALGTTNLVANKKDDLLRLIDNCNKVIVLTKWYKEILITNGIPDNKITSINPGLPITTKISIKSKEHNLKLKFLFVGRISHFKGLHILVDAFNRLIEYNAELDIYGQTDDIDYEKLLKLKTSCNNSIQWKGILPNKDVVEVMSNYDVLCLCSTFSEMSPLVIQEAFAARLPVIASNVYGNAEQIKHGVNGLLFKFNDTADLLKQLQRCIEEKDLLLNLSRNILPPRSFEEVANDHIKLYNSLLS